MITKQEYENALKCINDYRLQLLSEIETRKKEIAEIDKIKLLTVKKTMRLLDLDLSVRALNWLKANEKETIEDLLLIDFSNTRELNMRRIGGKTIKELEDCISNLIIEP
jgi:DNA-directed RNA polymerase alpha subunit